MFEFCPGLGLCTARLNWLCTATAVIVSRLFSQCPFFRKEDGHNALIKLWWEPQSRGSLSVTLEPTPTIVLAKSLFGLKTESLVWVGAFVCCSTCHVDSF